MKTNMINRIANVTVGYPIWGLYYLVLSTTYVPGLLSRAWTGLWHYTGVLVVALGTLLLFLLLEDKREWPKHVLGFVCLNILGPIVEYIGRNMRAKRIRSRKIKFQFNL